MERTTSMTVEEFERVADSFGSCELVQGRVVLMSPGGPLHSRASVQTAIILGAYCERVKTGRVLGNEAGIVTDLPRGTVRGADVLYISYKRLAKGQLFDSFLRTPPELIAEIKGATDTWKNLKSKVSEYHRLGVDLVWVIDPKTRSVRIYPNGGITTIKNEHEMIDGGPVLPKFKCKIARFFED